jgi:hypothetical protein
MYLVPDAQVSSQRLHLKSNIWDCTAASLQFRRIAGPVGMSSFRTLKPTL